MPPCADCAENYELPLYNEWLGQSIYRTFQAVKRGEPFAEDEFDILLNKRGFLSRIFRPLLGLATSS
jgi:high-affinity nickel-transport protein